MRKKFAAFILTGALVFSVCALVGNAETATESTEIEIVQGEENTLSFEQLANRQFCFSSGAGGWATLLTIQADGSFSGEYYDSEMGDTGDEYPNGSMYLSHFSGMFTQPEKLNEYTYRMQISKLEYDKEVGTQEIKDGLRYQYSEVYGLDGAENILVYLPGAPIAELPQEFRSWVGYFDLTAATDTDLPFYALYNETQQCGFSSYSFTDSLKEIVAATEESAATLENSIKNDPLSQAELNEKTKELYDLWDSVLNRIWDVLNQTKDEETMSSITSEELAWINQKEEAVAQAGTEFEGGSAQPMVMNQKAAEMTKDRVYELLKLFE